LIMTAGNYWMSQLNLDISPGQAVWPLVLVVAGLAVCFAPANIAAYLYTPMALRGAAVGLLSLLRNEGGSVGTSLAQTFQERRDQFHTLRLGEYLDTFNAAANSFLAHAQTFFLQQTADPVASQQLAWQQLENLRQQQASALAYFDSFWDDRRVDVCDRVPGTFNETQQDTVGPAPDGPVLGWAGTRPFGPAEAGRLRQAARFVAAPLAALAARAALAALLEAYLGRRSAARVQAGALRPRRRGDHPRRAALCRSA
jgi:hypothetical protein